MLTHFFAGSVYVSRFIKYSSPFQELKNYQLQFPHLHKERDGLVWLCFPVLYSSNEQMDFYWKVDLFIFAKSQTELTLSDYYYF